MTVIEWKAEFELGLAAMDETHREFVALLNDMATAGDTEMEEMLDRFIAHTGAHFEQENHWMRLSDFPPIGCHMGEHERVLTVLFEVRRMVRTGQPRVARWLAAELAKWFEGHAATMDYALAAYIRQTGFDVTAQSLRSATIGIPPTV